jgi:uncharacterized protein (PEP-CTERM system associated)
MAASPVLAQQQTFRVMPSVRFTETITDNAGLRNAGETKTDWITQISPGLSVDARGARVTGSFSASVNAIHYGNGTSADSTSLAFNGRQHHGPGESSVCRSQRVGEPHGHLGLRCEARGHGDRHQQTSERLQHQPLLHDPVRNTGSLQLRYTQGVSDSGSTAMAKTTSQSWALSASDPRMTGRLGWGLNVLDQTSDNSASSRQLKQQTARLTGMAQVMPELMLRLIVGAESNNYRISNQSSSIYGAGADWTPTPRTRVAATVEDRFFGTGYTLAADHRSSQMVYRASFSKDATTTSNSMLSPLSYADFFFEPLMRQYASLYPNVAEREAFVRQLLASMPQGQVYQPVLTNATFLDKRLQVGATYLGQRNSLGLVVFQSLRDSLVERDFAVSNDLQAGSQLRTTGATLTLSHQVTGLTNLNASFSSTRSRNEGLVSQSSDSRLLTVGVSSRLTPKATGMLNARRNEGSYSTSDYTENAVIGSLAIQF